MVLISLLLYCYCFYAFVMRAACCMYRGRSIHRVLELKFHKATDVFSRISQSHGLAPRGAMKTLNLKHFVRGVSCIR